jgi:hypothetical protein
MKGELREGIIQFPLGNYNLEILVKNNEIKDYTAEQTKNRFEKIYYCHNNPEKDTMTETEYIEFERNNSILIDFICEIIMDCPP